MKQFVTENAEEAKQAFRNNWQVVKTTVMKTFTKYSVIQVNVDTEMTEESEIEP